MPRVSLYRVRLAAARQATAELTLYARSPEHAVSDALLATNHDALDWSNGPMEQPAVVSVQLVEEAAPEDDQREARISAGLVYANAAQALRQAEKRVTSLESSLSATDIGSEERQRCQDAIFLSRARVCGLVAACDSAALAYDRISVAS